MKTQDQLLIELCESENELTRLISETGNESLMDKFLEWQGLRYKANEKFVEWISKPFEEKRDRPEVDELLDGLVRDVSSLLQETDHEWQEAGYYNAAKEYLKRQENDVKYIKITKISLEEFSERFKAQFVFKAISRPTLNATIEIQHDIYLENLKAGNIMSVEEFSKDAMEEEVLVILGMQLKSKAEKMKAIRDNFGLQWVLSSDKLPNLETNIFLKDNLGNKRFGNFFKQDGNIVLAIHGNNNYADYYVPEKLFKDFYWLHEAKSS